MNYAVFTKNTLWAVATDKSDALAEARANGLDTLAVEYFVAEVSEDFALDFSQRGDWQQYQIVEDCLIEDRAAIAKGLASR